VKIIQLVKREAAGHENWKKTKTKEGKAKQGTGGGRKVS